MNKREPYSLKRSTIYYFCMKNLQNLYKQSYVCCLPVSETAFTDVVLIFGAQQ